MRFLAFRWFLFLTVIGPPALAVAKLLGAPIPWLAVFAPWFAQAVVVALIVVACAIIGARDGRSRS